MHTQGVYDRKSFLPFNAHHASILQTTFLSKNNNFKENRKEKVFFPPPYMTNIYVAFRYDKITSTAGITSFLLRRKRTPMNLTV